MRPGRATAGAGPVRPAPPVPAGFKIAADGATRELPGGVVWGGSPPRVMRLTAAGSAAWRELRTGPVASREAGALARRLTDAGAAHPCPPAPTAPPDVTVVIPVRDRPGLLARCLAALGRDHPVLVVDDGSRDAAGLARVAARSGAAVVRREVNGGPGAARNAGLAAARTELVAFLDSDCEPPPGWISALAAHFADPLVGAAAPRITGLAAPTWAGRYTAARGSLDLGDRPALVAPGARVPYVPTAALVARRAALLAVARGGAVFDPSLRTGEDVDLVWRLAGAGWRVRYEPSVRVGHHEPVTWAGLLARRFRYGTSAAPLARRHPGAVPPLVVFPWPALAAAALLAGRPVTAGLAAGGTALAITRALRRAGLPVRGAPRAALGAIAGTWLGAGRYGTQFGAPLLLALTAAPGGSTPARRRLRRLALGSLLVGPPAASWAATRPELGPVRFAFAHLADDVAYGSGVWAGCARERMLAPALPVIRLPVVTGAGGRGSRRHANVSVGPAAAGRCRTGGGSPPAPPTR